MENTNKHIVNYEADIDTFGGQIHVSYNNHQINKTDLASRLREDYRRGVVVTPAEIAMAAFREIGLIDENVTATMSRAHFWNL